MKCTEFLGSDFMTLARGKFTRRERDSYNRGVIDGAAIAKEMKDKGWDKGYSFTEELWRRIRLLGNDPAGQRKRPA